MFVMYTPFHKPCSSSPFSLFPSFISLCSPLFSFVLRYGCSYSYMKHSIMSNETVEMMPPLLEDLIDRLVSTGVLPRSKRPNSAIINVYSEGDCIPPHIDHHDFDRPFCTVSMLSTQNMVLGTKIKIINEGQFAGAESISLLRRSCLVLDGNGADVAKHCVPSVTQERVSITFRCMQKKWSKEIEQKQWFRDMEYEAKEGKSRF